MAPIEGRNLTQLRDVFEKHDVEYLFVGKMAAILQGYPDTTQDADLFIEKGSDNGKRVISALRELGFKLDDELANEIQQGRDFIQLTDGPFDLDLVHAPDGIERYDDARRRAVEMDGFPLCSIDDIIESKRRSNREKDRESLPRLEDFSRYLKREPPAELKPLPPRQKAMRHGGDKTIPSPPQRPKASTGTQPSEQRPEPNRTRR